MIIKDRHKGSAEISATGGTVTRWQSQGKDILFPQQEKTVNGKKKLRGGIPVCAPFWGWPRGIYKEFCTEKHGWIQKEKHRIESNDLNPHLARIRYLYNGFSQNKVFIPPFSAVFTYAETSGHKLYTAMEFKTESRDIGIPMNPAFHDHYNAPNGWEIIKDGIAYYKSENWGADSAFVEVIPLLNAFITVWLRGIGQVHIEPRGNFPDGCPYMAIWTDSSKYICVETVYHDHSKLGKENGFWLKEEDPLYMRVERSFEPSAPPFTIF